MKSPLKLQLSIIGTTLVFIILISFLVGLTQDYLANDSTKFNQVVTLIIHGIFQSDIGPTMKVLSSLSNQWILMVTSALTVLWILFFKQYKLIELLFFGTTIGGGIGVVMGLNHLAHFISPNHPIITGYTSATFLNSSFLNVLLIAGFFIYIITQQSKKVYLPTLGIGFFIVISILMGISKMWLGIEPPSNIITSFIFAGVWLSLNIVLLDIFRELRRIQLNPN